MKAIIRLRTHFEQVADFLVDELKRGRWTKRMPGVLLLEKEFGMNRNTMEAALRTLEWFVQEQIPGFALFGRRQCLDMAGAGPDMVKALRQAVARLVGLGHQRIVLLNHQTRRLPEPALLERAFILALEQKGIPTGS